MKPAILDHIGIAVRPDSRLAEALAILGLPVTGSETVEREKVDTDWIPLPVQPGNIELLKPTEKDSVIGKFLEKSGRDGIHHLSFRVEDIEAVSAQFIQAGFKMVYPAAKPGAHRCLVNFIHPATTGGVLLELSEKTYPYGE
ncbi:MAG: VOC family protein [Bacteriovoracia bacterium]